MTALIAKQVAAGVPIFDLIAKGKDVGLLTNFPGEGIVFTVRHDGDKVTDYSAATMHEAIEKATETFAALVAGTHFPPEEDYIEDEDGDIAFARMLERRAGDGRHEEDEVPYY
jgi:hypothetical protein